MIEGNGSDVRKLTVGLAALVVTVGLVPGFGYAGSGDDIQEIDHPEVNDGPPDLAAFSDDDSVNASLANVSDLVEPVSSLGEDSLPETELAHAVDHLVENTTALYEELAFDVTASEVGIEEEIRGAGLDDTDQLTELTARINRVVYRAQECADETTFQFQRVLDDKLSTTPNQTELIDVLRHGEGLDADNFVDVHNCAVNLYTRATEVKIYLDDLLGLTSDCGDTADRQLRLWPVLSIDTRCVENTYVHDFMVQVDLGGDDAYHNNAGSNLIDTNFGPSDSPLVQNNANDTIGAARAGPSVGCTFAIPGIVPDGVPLEDDGFLEPFEPGEGQGQCRPLVAALIDQAGDDDYGQKQAPLRFEMDDQEGNDIPYGDDRCTDEPVVTRLMGIAGGFMGTGVLVEHEGDDDYTGKTGAIGTGHIFGQGILLEEDGDDDYTAIRNSIGFSLIGDVGVVRDRGGTDDDMTWYLPEPDEDKNISKSIDAADILPAFAGSGEDTDDDPYADTVPPSDRDADSQPGDNFNLFHEEMGPGGVIDDQGLCANRLRMTQGASTLGGIGVVSMEGDGTNVHEIGFSVDPDAPQTSGDCPGTDEGLCMAGGGLGWGQGGGTGVFLSPDGGDDRYNITNMTGAMDPGWECRRDGGTCDPGEPETGGPGRDDSNAPGVGLFKDRDAGLLS